MSPLEGRTAIITAGGAQSAGRVLAEHGVPHLEGAVVLFLAGDLSSHLTGTVPGGRFP